MEQGIPEAILSDTRLLQHLAEVAKDTALLNGVLMRTKEEPNSSEVGLGPQQWMCSVPTSKTSGSSNGTGFDPQTQIRRND